LSKERLNQNKRGRAAPAYHLRIDKKHITHGITISVQNHFKARHNSNLMGSGKSIPQTVEQKNKNPTQRGGD
jgi:hypothetical protein